MQPTTELQDALAAFQSGDLVRARQIAETAMGAGTPSPPLEHLIGLIECRAGRVESGVDWLRRAFEGDPANASYRVMLARALIDSGRSSEALEIVPRPSGTSPSDLAQWHVRAESAQASGDHESAAEAWKVMCAARPDDWRNWANYGEALARLEHWSDAANAFRRALMLNPNEIPIQQNFSTALARAGFYAEAADQLKLMLDRGPDDAGLRLELARLLADLGRNKESMGQLERAARLAVGEGQSGESNAGLIRIAIGSADPSEPISDAQFRSVRELALLLERTSRMDALRNLVRDAEERGITRDRLGYPIAALALRDGDAIEAKRLLELESAEVDPVRRYRLLAKIEDALGDPAKAFAAAIEMNRAVEDFDGWDRKGSDYRRRLRDLADSITPAWTARLRPLEPPERRSPAFLVGFPRSGTTLLDTFLMGHPDTEVLEEFHMLGAAEAVLGNAIHLPDTSPEKLRQARRAYFAELDKHIDAGFPGLAVDKLPLNMMGVQIIHTLFPDARIIFAQRHPCDAVLSGFMQSFLLNDAMACFLTIEAAADLYDVAMSIFTRACGALPIATHTLVYERLVADPAAVLRPLIDFLGLEWRPELLDHRSTAKARGTISTPSYDQVTQPLSKAPSGRWRRYEDQLAPVLPVLLPWARRLGYAD